MWCQALSVGAAVWARSVPPFFQARMLPLPRPSTTALEPPVSASIACVVLEAANLAHRLIVCAAFAAGIAAGDELVAYPVAPSKVSMSAFEKLMADGKPVVS